jgi:AcrR family transcriptional regulator
MSDTRVRNRRGEGARLRDDLLAAAAALVDERQSLDGVGLRAVAGRAGVTPNAVYRHFEDHDALLRATVEWCWERFVEAVIAGAPVDGTPYERLRASGEAYVAFAQEHRGWYRLMFSDAQLLPAGQDPPWLAAFQGLVGLVAEVLTAKGDDRDPWQVAIQIQSWTHGIVDLCTGGEPPMPGWPDAVELLDAVGDRLGVNED